MQDLTNLSFKEFYPIYLQAHRNPWTKLWHFAGQFLTLGYVVFTFWIVINFSLWALLYLWWTTEVVYLTAWPSHKFIEKNEPLGKTRKWISKLSDLKMFWDVLVTRKVPLDGRYV